MFVFIDDIHLMAEKQDPAKKHIFQRKHLAKTKTKHIQVSWPNSNILLAVGLLELSKTRALTFWQETLWGGGNGIEIRELDKKHVIFLMGCVGRDVATEN